jgi:hypothetical protein
MTTKTPRTPKLSTPQLPRYNPVAVNKAIEASNRAGRKISGKEAKLIHALLKGRG